MGQAMTEAERIAETIRGALPEVKVGSLRFWGRWFGRPHDNRHTIVGCEAEDDLLVLRFDDDEVLRVWGARDAMVGPEALSIGSARRVRWEWFSYGEPKEPENLLFEELERDGDEVRARTNVPWNRSWFQLDLSLPAVEIL